MAARWGSKAFPCGTPNGESSVNSVVPWSTYPYPNTIDWVTNRRAPVACAASRR